MSLKEKVRALVSNVKMLNADEIELIVEKTNVVEFKKGTILLREGEISKKCYMIIEGCVREYLIKDGEEKSTDFFIECDSFSPAPRVEKPSKHYWECIEDCILTVSDKSHEEQLREVLPRLDAIFQDIAIEKINKLKEEWMQFVSSSPEERYLNLLETKPHLLNRVPQYQIASYIGMKPQSLSRIRSRIFNKE